MTLVIVKRALQFDQNGKGVFLHPTPLLQNIPAAWLCFPFIRDNVIVVDTLTETPEREQGEEARIKENNAYNSILERGKGDESKKVKRGRVNAE